MEEALYETALLRQFAGLSLERIPDETTRLNFRRLLQLFSLFGLANLLLAKRYLMPVNGMNPS